MMDNSDGKLSDLTSIDDEVCDPVLHSLNATKTARASHSALKAGSPQAAWNHFRSASGRPSANHLAPL